MSRGKILFQLSGSIAGFKACQLLSRLKQEGYEIEVVATASALKFVGEATLEGLSGRRTHTDLWAAGDAMSHIGLMRWADLVLLCPASANSLNKLASGIADDLLTTLFLAHDFKKPYLVAPAMNHQMLRHPATQKSLALLRSWGVEILETAAGSLACGETGEGRLLEPEELLRAIQSRLAPPRTGRKVLVTSGGTKEPIDGVRALTNTSSGRTGAAIAARLQQAGDDVTLLRAADSASAPGVRDLTFVTFADLENALKRELGAHDYAVVVHAAAVSDYSLGSIATSDGRALGASGKIDSGGDLVLTLKRNPKLVDALRSYSRNPRLKVVAFKLTNTEDETERLRAIEKLAEHARPDFIVHNDLREIDPATDRHRARIFKAPFAQAIADTPTRAGVASAIATLIQELE